MGGGSIEGNWVCEQFHAYPIEVVFFLLFRSNQAGFSQIVILEEGVFFDHAFEVVFVSEALLDDDFTHGQTPSEANLSPDHIAKVFIVGGE